MHRIAVFVIILAAALGVAARADVPALLSFQGILKSSAGVPLEGAQSVRFTLYNAAEGDQIVTDEIQTFGNGTVTLNHCPVVAGSETVKKSDNTATYTRGTAYTIDNASGTITSIAIPNGTSVKVSYRWSASSYWTETQTVQATHGLFSALLGISTSVPYYSLSGSDWVGVEVFNGAIWQTLSPRLRLSSAPYALRVLSIDGASGGSINGSVTSSATVTGTGRSFKILNFPTTYPGIQGNGVTGLGGEAPGVLAVGVNNTGLALQALGRITASGDISGANLSLTGNATVPGNSYVYGNGQVSGLLNVGNLVAAGTVQGAAITSTANALVGQDLVVTRDATVLRNATVNGNLGISGTTTAQAVTAAGSITGANLYTQGNVAANGNISAVGTVAGIGAQKPDYDSGVKSMAIGTSGQGNDLPASLGKDPYGIIVDFTFERPAMVGSTPITLYSPPSPSTMTYDIRTDPPTGTNLWLWVSRAEWSTVGHYRFRVWKLR